MKTKKQKVEYLDLLVLKKSKIVNMPQVQSVKMVITQPTSFEQSEEICNYLKEKSQ